MIASKAPRISIITVVFNREMTIGSAITSVAQQSFDDLEHIIVDGGSSDGTLNKISRLKHDKMRIVSEPDKGIYDALNKGMALARGEIIGLVHSDDWLAHDDVLAKVAQDFADKNVQAVYGDLDYVAADKPDHVVRHWRSGSFHIRKLRRGWMPPHPALFIHRKVYEKYGGYDTSYKIAADYDAILRWFGSGSLDASYIPEVLVKMRLGGESNRSIERICLKSREDLRAIQSNGVGGIVTLAMKNLSKISQFFIKDNHLA